MTTDPAGIILAGGEGQRLRAFIRALVGEERPKQFCAIVGDDTLLDQTRRRARMLVDDERLLTVVTAAHERFYVPALAGIAPETIVVQPAGRGTAPAILYALLRLDASAHRGPVVLFPSDHYVSDDAAFIASVGDAVDAARRHPDRVVLLGIPPDRADVQYGWIEPGEHLSGTDGGAVHAVRRFWEKPARAISDRLRGAGGLWNSFVLVAERESLAQLIRRAAPGLWRAFHPLATLAGTRVEPAAARAVYRTLHPVDFSREILETDPSSLAVLPVSRIVWNDLGEPDRVLATRRSLEWRAVTA